MKSAKMCEMKFKNLKRSYVNCVDHNNTTGMIPNNAISLPSYTRFCHVMMSYSQRQPVAIWMALSESEGRPAMKGEAIHSHHQ